MHELNPQPSSAKTSNSDELRTSQPYGVVANGKSDAYCRTPSASVLSGVSHLDMEGAMPNRGYSTNPNDASSLWIRITKCPIKHMRLMRKHPVILILAVLVFIVIAASSVAMTNYFADQASNSRKQESLSMAINTGDWFSSELDKAILPLFSIAQFATELQMFDGLPEQIGHGGQPGALPFLPSKDPLQIPLFRNVTGVCDDPAVVARFNKIASSIKRNAKMQGVLVNIQLSPLGVICLLFPLNNTEDFPPGVFMDNSGVRGLDLFADPVSRYIVESTLAKENVIIEGPRPLRQCKNCSTVVEKAFIARYPIQSDRHRIVVNGTSYNRWGFATALINWEQLVNRSDVYDNFIQRNMEFRLTRTDRKYIATTNSYSTQVVVLAESDNFHQGRSSSVSTALQTTNNEWSMTVLYDDPPIHQWRNSVLLACILAATVLACMVYMILIQRQLHTEMKGYSLAQQSTLDVERNMTAYFAHEVRNPMQAVQCALDAMPEDLPMEAKELVFAMKHCSSFMSAIMNNLLDVRQMQEGKMTLDVQPMSVCELLVQIHSMLSPSVKCGVEFKVLDDTQGRQWVLGDRHRIAQVITNIATNALKYTVSGSVTLAVRCESCNVRFECIDTGPGILKSEQQKLFQRFVRRGGAPGSGLGLVIAKHIVVSMGGSIGFDSDPTVKPGTTCYVLLPLAACEPEEPITEPIDGSHLKGLISFLIVDDVKMNRTMLKKRIEKSIAPDSIIREASSGEEGIRICESEHFDVIIVDQYMEQSGGILLGTDAVVVLRRMKVDSVIIGCSGNDVASEFLQAGADIFWQKPMPSNDVIISQLRSRLRPDHILESV